MLIHYEPIIVINFMHLYSNSSFATFMSRLWIRKINYSV